MANFLEKTLKFVTGGSGLGGILGAVGGFLLGGPAGAVLGGAAGAGAGASYDQGKAQLKATLLAAKKQEEQARALATQQQEQYNKINQKKPNVGIIKSQNVLSDMPQTQLTDIAGIPLLSLLLSQNTSLGGGQAIDQSNNIMSFLARNRGSNNAL